MPLVQTITTTDKEQIGLWQITEELIFLLKKLPKETAKVNSFGSLRRKKEWLCVRLLLAEMLQKTNVEISYNLHKKPYLKNEMYQISISHSLEYVAIILHEKKQVGIDVENIHPRVEKIKQKFLTKGEQNLLLNQPQFMLTAFWSAKETLYKWYSKKGVDFKKHLQIVKVKHNKKESEIYSGYIEAIFAKENIRKQLKINYRKINNHILTHLVAEI
ncbi:MAG: 4'-phosphopantetheinyl transferase family protein [Chitinophagales bacterium]